MSKIIAAILVAGLSTLGLTLSESSALELVLVLINLGSLVVAYVSRVRMGGVNAMGLRK